MKAMKRGLVITLRNGWSPHWNVDSIITILFF